MADLRSLVLGFATGSAFRSARLATPKTFDRFWIVPDVQFDLGPSGAEAAAGLGVAAAGAGGDGTGFDGLMEAAAAEFEGAIVTVTVGVTVIVVVADGVPETDATCETAAGGTGAAFDAVAGETGTVVIKVVIGMAVMS